MCVHAYECVGVCILDTYAEARGGHECPLQACVSVRLANRSAFRILCLLFPNVGVTDIHSYDCFFLHGLSGFEPWSSGLHSKWSYPLSLVLRHCIYFLYCGIQSMWGTKEMLYFAFALNSLCVSKHF